MEVTYIPTGEVRNHKDTVFVDLFAKDIDAPKNFLSLYNALHGTNLTPENTTLKPMILENVLFQGLGNDVAMEVNGQIIVLAEHQSTVNENMPLRCLEYISRLFEFSLRGKSKFQKKPVKIPFPEFYVFYNGKADYPREKTLRLSDSYFKNNFPGTENFPLELSVKVININKCKNHPVLKKCSAMAGYTDFVELVRKEKSNRSENPIETAVEKAAANGILSDYLRRRSVEVINMIFGEWDKDEWAEVIREETTEDVTREVTIKVTEDVTKNVSLEKAVVAVKKYNLTPETVAEDFNVPLEKLKEALGSN